MECSNDVILDKIEMNTQHTLPIYHYHKMQWNVLTIGWGRQDIDVKSFKPKKKLMQFFFIHLKWSKVLNALNMETQMNMYLTINNFIFLFKQLHVGKFPILYSNDKFKDFLMS